MHVLGANCQYPKLGVRIPAHSPRAVVKMQLWLYYGRLCVYPKHSSFVRLFVHPNISHSIPFQHVLSHPARILAYTRDSFHALSGQSGLQLCSCHPTSTPMLGARCWSMANKLSTYYPGQKQISPLSQKLALCVACYRTKPASLMTSPILRFPNSRCEKHLWCVILENALEWLWNLQKIDFMDRNKGY